MLMFKFLNILKILKEILIEFLKKQLAWNQMIMQISSIFSSFRSQNIFYTYFLLNWWQLFW